MQLRGNPLNRSQRPETSPAARISEGSYQKAFNTALRLLTRRDHSKYELSQKLKQRNFEDDIIEKVFQECERLDYLNDERTARVLIDQLLRKGYGAKRIQHDLNRKGLTGKRMADIFTAKISDLIERESAERVLAKNIRRYDRENDRQKRNDKIYRFLYSRGFSNEVISELMKKY
jgi:regulatory protein